MKRILNCLILFVLTFCMIVPAFASDVRTGNVTGVDVVYNDTKNAVDSTINEMIDTTVTTESVVDRLESKSNDIQIMMLQTSIKYICIVAFVVCCILICCILILKRTLRDSRRRISDEPVQSECSNQLNKNGNDIVS